MWLSIRNIRMGGVKRDSNMELLRIIAMFLVMMIHTTQTIHYPEFDGKEISSVEFGFVSLLRSISFIAVNVFVLLSGWYGIRFTIKGLFRLVYQVAFFSLLCYAVSVVTKAQPFSPKSLLLEGFLIGQNTYWFVQSYVLLFVLSPILNNFCENVERNTFRSVLVTYLAIMVYGGWLTQAMSGEIEGGLSVVFFIGLYLLARYMRIYSPQFTTLTLPKDIFIFLLLTAVIAVIAVATHGGTLLMGNVYTYTCPLIVASSVFLLLAFSKMQFQSKCVNFIASSCFAVYLLHEHVSICKPLYRLTVRTLYNNENPYLTNWIDVVLFMLIIYVVAIIIDKIRLFIFSIR